MVLVNVKYCNDAIKRPPSNKRPLPNISPLSYPKN